MWLFSAEADDASWRNTMFWYLEEIPQTFFFVFRLARSITITNNGPKSGVDGLGGSELDYAKLSGSETDESEEFEVVDYRVCWNLQRSKCQSECEVCCTSCFRRFFVCFRRRDCARNFSPLRQLRKSERENVNHLNSRREINQIELRGLTVVLTPSGLRIVWGLNCFIWAKF
jgi:hypothetical protein